MMAHETAESKKRIYLNRSGDDSDKALVVLFLRLHKMLVRINAGENQGYRKRSYWNANIKHNSVVTPVAVILLLCQRGALYILGERNTMT
jgi:hypothetical protein